MPTAQPVAQINWHTSPEDYRLICEIVKRAKKLAPRQLTTLAMDIACVHANEDGPLRLLDLLRADDFNFAHDIAGIVRHLNRQTGKLENFFVPRFVVRQPSTGEDQPMKLALIHPDTSPEPYAYCTLAEYLEANDLEPEERAELEALPVGGELRVGGGAAPLFAVRRVA